MVAGAFLLAWPCVVQVAAAQEAVARMPVSDANVKGAVEIKNGQMEMSSGVQVNAGQHATEIQLARGGKVKLCAFSGVHISKGTNPSEVMLALDHGAMEVHGMLGDFSDVLMTPDMRLILSGPGTEDLGIRVNGQGDTCVNNAGPHAPYVTVTEQLGSGLYRVQAGQHITFEHGSVGAVVDSEKEPCGCPPEPAVSVADAGASAAAGTAVAKPGAAVGGSAGASAKPAFPLAESEGLAPPEKPQTVPAVPAGTVHAEVTIPFRYDGSAAPATSAAGTNAEAGTGSGSAGGPPSAGMGAMGMSAEPAAAATQPSAVTSTASAGTAGSATTATATTSGTAVAAAPGTTAKQPKPDDQRGGWHAVKRFFKRLFGG